MLSHGDGGKYTNDLIKNVFYKNFYNSLLVEGLDSATFKMKSCNLAFTTDSFTVKPIFFRGGDIGKLSLCGTINDLVAAGAKPLFISVGFIIEEGFYISDLIKIVKSMSTICKETGVKIITGDTKVIEKGKVDEIFINTSGIGVVNENFKNKKINPGDEIIITGTVAEHGTAIATEQYNLNIEGNLISDCRSLDTLLIHLFQYLNHIKMMTDPTRGGLATALNEIIERNGLGIKIIEDNIPIRPEVESICNLLGFDPLYLASEGRLILIVEKGYGQTILEFIQKLEFCRDAQIIGNFVKEPAGIVYLETKIGGKRILNMLEGRMLPRIC